MIRSNWEEFYRKLEGILILKLIAMELSIIQSKGIQ